MELLLVVLYCLHNILLLIVIVYSLLFTIFIIIVVIIIIHTPEIKVFLPPKLHKWLITKLTTQTHNHPFANQSVNILLLKCISGY
jgi:hypothetical protein